MKRSESRIGVPHGGQSLETTGSRGRRTKRGPAGFRILTDWLPRLQPRVLGAGDGSAALVLVGGRSPRVPRRGRRRFDLRDGILGAGPELLGQPVRGRAGG